MLFIKGCDWWKDPAIKVCADIHGAQRMNPTDFGDPLTFHLAPLLGKNSIYPILWFVVKHTEQKYKLNIFIFTPIFHELKENICFA